MPIHSSEIRVGLMVVLSISLIIILSISVGQLGDLLTDTIRVKIQIPGVAGLEEYAPVKYSGVPIGRVMKIEYDETVDLAVIHADIERDSPVSLDSICRLSSSSMLAPLYIEITGGTREQKLKYLLNDKEIKEVDIVLNAEQYLSIGDLFALAADVKNTLIKVQTVLDNVNEPLMVAGDLIKNISGESEVLLENLNLLVEDSHVLLKNTLASAGDFIDSTSSEMIPSLKNIRVSTGKLPPLLTSIDGKLKNLLDDADLLIQNIQPEIQAVSTEMQTTIRSLKGRLSTIEENLVTVLDNADGMLSENRDQVKLMLQNLQRTSKNLDDLMAQLSQHPWRILWKTEAREQPAKVSPDWKPILQN